MADDLDSVRKALIARIYRLHQTKFEGNNRMFARAADCDEKAIRQLFDERKSTGMTLNLLFKLAFALEKTPSELLDGLEIQKKEG